MQYVIYNDKQVVPSKIICIGRNYRAHAEELGNAVPKEPVIFLKPNSSISNRLMAGCPEVNAYEGEMCFMIKDGEFSAVGFGLDLTKRETQNRLKQAGLPWERAKAFDGAAVFGPFVSIKPTDIDHLSLSLFIDGEQRQAGSVQDMLFKPQFILDEIKSLFTLNDGDIVMTGTPEGVGEVRKGAMFKGTITVGETNLAECEWRAE